MNRRIVSIKEAKRIIAQDRADALENEEEHVAHTYMARATRPQLVRMMETVRNLEGRKLTGPEFGALVSVWEDVFGGKPPIRSEAAPASGQTPNTRPFETHLPRSEEQRAAGPHLKGNQVWDVKAVAEQTSLSPSTIRRRVREGLFPPPIQLSQRRKGWKAADVIAWSEARRGSGRHRY